MATLASHLASARDSSHLARDWWLRLRSGLAEGLGLGSESWFRVGGDKEGRLTVGSSGAWRGFAAPGQSKSGAPAYQEVVPLFILLGP